ncbi:MULTISPECIES: PIN domain-containing protein [unclassified Variovorax]|uniref:PIN domain-containing protein n=1 Tax=unclassified Variovorax TaxID=663243 RepID=UPI003F489AC1
MTKPKEAMFNVLIDTSVWLSLAEDQKQTPLLKLLVGLLSGGRINILVPRIVLTEFLTNRDRVSKASAKSLQTHFHLVSDAIRKTTGEQREKVKVLDYLMNANHQIPLLGGAAEGTLKHIETILKTAIPIEASNEIKVRAADRALNRKAPCHHENKNSMADAVLIETYFDCVKKGKAGDRFAFVTHNKLDFSLIGGNAKLPHPDIAGGFTKIKSLYYINLGECLRKIDPQQMQYVDWDRELETEPRSLAEIQEAAHRLTLQVWHNRHKNRAWEIKQGKLKVVSREKWSKTKGYNHSEIIDEVWKGACQSAKKAERELGTGNHGPYSDFEWGMINGKLSAIRWMWGEDWDELYT